MPSAPRRRTPAKRAAPTRKAAARRPAVRSAAPKILPGPGQRLWILDVPFEEGRLAGAAGATWDGTRKAFVYVGVKLPASLTSYLSERHSWERFQEDDINGGPVAGEPLLSTPMVPRLRQVEAADAVEAAAVAGYRGFVVADSTGVGKTIAMTISVLRIARLRRVRTVLVTCPAGGAVSQWRRTIDAIPGTGDIRWVVLNYERLASRLLVADTTAKTRKDQVRATLRTGRNRVAWDVVVADESHKAKSLYQTSSFLGKNGKTVVQDESAQRARALEAVARYGAAKEDAPFVIWASATIGQTPLDLGYLAPLLAQRTNRSAADFADFGGWLADNGFRVRRERGEWAWTDDPAERDADLDRVNRLLYGGRVPVAIRRLPDWPKPRPIPVPVDLDRDQRRLYEQAWTEFRAEYGLAQRGRDAARGRAAKMRFRQKVSLIRVPGTVGQVRDLLDNGHQVCVSVFWSESVDALADGLRKVNVEPAVYVGSMGRPEKDRAQLAFQRGEHRVILFSVVEAINLHASELLADGSRATPARRATVVHDPRYSGIESIQVMGRASRDGQVADAYYPYARGTVDEQVLAAFLGRIVTTNGMHGDDVSLERHLEGVLTGEVSDVPTISEAERLVEAAQAAALASEVASGGVGRGRHP